jgi:L-asparaginase/beta-aspartyl-peptidase (threonine type)
VSSTGQGEFFIRTAAAVQVAHRMRFGGESLASAGEAVLREIANAGGEGGLIAVSADGEVAMPFSSEGMKRAALHPDGTITAEAF